MRRIALQPLSDRFRLPVLPMTLLALWAALVGAATWLGQVAGSDPSLCAFRNITGVPCATCGGTRAALALGRGDLPAALAFNPLLTLGLVAFAGWAALRFGLGRRLVVDPPSTARRALWTLLAVAFVLNWVYVIWRGV